MGKPRPNGKPPGKWAILSLDDGTGTIEGMCFQKAWESYSKIESEVDNLVMLCGEISHRTNYDKSDVERLHPSVGELSFTIKEAYPIQEALPLISNALRLKISRNDKDAIDKVERIKALASRFPGNLPLHIDIAFDDGSLASVDLGPTCKAAINLGFLSELAKILPQSDTTFTPNDKIYLAPPPPRPWEG